MRYFLAFWVLAIVVVVSVSGLRDGFSRKPPLELFPDMDRQPKLQPEHGSVLFPDGRGSRVAVEGTIAHSGSYQVDGQPFLVNGQPVFPYQDHPINTGQMIGKTNFVETNPLPITPQLLARGKDRFTIYCTPCHGALADGTGITKRLGMPVVANLHDPRIVRLADGELFYVITHGRNLMGAYGPVLQPADRWAVIAYVRALQLSWVARAEDLPPAERANLKK